MSRHHRLGLALEAGGTYVVPGAAAHHLGRVLRARVGERFVAVAQDGSRWEARVTGLAPLTVKIVAPAPELAADPAVRLEVWLPLLKGGRTDDLVRQLTELGAARVVPWAAERSVVRLKGDKADRRVRRWRTIAAEATEQCGRATPPEVAQVSGLPASGPGVFLWEERGTALRDVLAAAPPERILVGPEGGLSPGEVEALVAVGWRGAWLGARILRAETAVVAAATLALHALGEAGY